MTTHHRRVPLLCLFVLPLLLLGAGGCGEYIGGSWGQLSPHRNDVTKVKKGWAPRTVINYIGEPLHVDVGQNVGIGWQEWIYPTGSVVFYRMEVTAVHVRHQGNEQLAEQLRNAERTTTPDHDTYSRSVNLRSRNRLEGLSGLSGLSELDDDQ